MLDGLADSDTAIHHGLIVREVKHEEIALVAEDFCYCECAFLTDPTISQMQVGQRLVVLDALRQEHCSLLPDTIVIQEELREETLVLERHRQGWDALLCNLRVCQSNDSKGFNVGQTLSNLGETFITDRVIVQVKLAQLELVREHFTKGRGSLTGDLIVFQVKRQERVVVFEGAAQGDRTSVPNTIVLKTYFLKTVHHLHALCESLATNLTDVIRVAVELAESVIVPQLLGHFLRPHRPNVIVINVKHSQILLVLQALGESNGTGW